MKDLMGMMKQVKDMQERMQRVQEELAAIEVDGTAGGGLVTATLNGKGDMKRVHIDPSLMKPEEAEIVEDLYIRCLCRKPTEKEQAELAKLIDEQQDKRKALEDVFWALLNSREFMFNH